MHLLLLAKLVEALLLPMEAAAPPTATQSVATGLRENAAPRMGFAVARQLTVVKVAKAGHVQVLQ